MFSKPNNHDPHQSRRIVALVIALLLCAFCLAPAARTQAQEPVKIAYVEWSSAIASCNLIKVVLEEKLKQPCELVLVDAEEMWRMVATGEVDAMLSAWLPSTHEGYYKTYGDKLVDLGPNLEGTKIGLVVPKVTAGRLSAGTGLRNRPYLTTESIPQLAADAAKYKHRIIGIDPGAGVMLKTRKAMDVYGLQDDFRLITGSEISMVAELSHAIRQQRWIVVTGWKPHWIFSRWELEFLDDPKNVFGNGGHISTMVRKGLQQDRPDVYALLDNFHWTPEEMGQLMLWIQDDKGMFPYEKAQRWIRSHQERVASWLP